MSSDDGGVSKVMINVYLQDREITELKIKSSELDTIRNELERDIKNERR